MLGKLELRVWMLKALPLAKLRAGQRDEFVTRPEQGRDAHGDVGNPQDLEKKSRKPLGSL